MLINLINLGYDKEMINDCLNKISIDNLDELKEKEKEKIRKKLERKYSESPDIFLITLDVIAGNLTIMTKAMKDIVNDTAGIVGKDEYRGDKKSTQLSAFLASQNNISKLVDKFGWTPSAKSKIRESQDAADVAKYLESLTK